MEDNFTEGNEGNEEFYFFPSKDRGELASPSLPSLPFVKISPALLRENVTGELGNFDAQSTMSLCI